MSEQGLTRNAIISELTRSPHGQLEQYAPIATRAAAEDPGFLSHLIAWNEHKGQVRDSKVALPVLALTSAGLYGDAELRDNALAHVASLDPRNLVRALRFSKSQPVKSRCAIARTVERYLRHREKSNHRFERVAMQHRRSLKELYALGHIKPSEYAGRILFAGEKLGVFRDIAMLKDMAPAEAAGTIMTKRIPFLVAAGALGAKMREPAVVQALIEAMTPTELVTNMKRLERLGVKNDPVLRGALEKGLAKASQATRAPTLKTARAAAAVGGQLGEKLQATQEKQLDKLEVAGDWLVVCDKSASMTEAIEVARQISALLARVAAGKVYLVFADTSVQFFDVTDKTHEQILETTKRISAGGGTSLGVALQYAEQKGLQIDGIAMATDGAENSAPMFASAYTRLCAKLEKQLPVYVYWLKCHMPNASNNNPDALAKNCEAADVALDVFDLRGGVDFYSLPNLVATMRSNRFGLVDEILETPLLRLEDVFAEKALAVN